MNRPDQRLQDLFDGDPYFEQEYHQDYIETAWEPFTRAGFILPFLLFLVALAYHLFYILDFNLLPLPELLWNVLVYLTPTKLLDFIETYTNPSRNPELRGLRRTHASKSEAMRRILGMDAPGGIISTVTQAGRRRLSSISGIAMVAQGGDGRPPGLGNWDNSCYQNSVLQGLASLDPLSDYLTTPQIDEEMLDKASKPDMKMAEALRGLIETLKDPSNNGRRIWTPATLKSMSSWQQQDAQEYFSKVLDEIDKEVGKAAESTRKFRGLESDQSSALKPSDAKSPPLSTFRNPLEGLIAQRVGCTKCGYSEGLSMIPFNCLTVPLSKAWEQDISVCLDEYTKLERIEGVECGKCTLLKFQRLLSAILERVKDDPEESPIRKQTTERLNAVNDALEDDDYEDKTLQQKCNIPAKGRVSSTKSRQAVVARPPKSLVVHFNRSLFDETTGELRKNSSEVRFPKILDLGPWCLGSSGISTNAAMEEWLLNPEQSMIASNGGASRLHGPFYELRAVVTHYGRHENGHYICYKKHPSTAVDEKGFAKEQWWRLSDDDVMKVSEDNVLGQGGVFMLFYDCIESGTTTSSNADVPEAANIHPQTSPVEAVEVVEAANIPLPDDDADLSDSEDEALISPARDESVATSDNEDIEENEPTDYKPTKAILVPPYIPPAGVHKKNEGAAQQDILSPGSLLMV